MLRGTNRHCIVYKLLLFHYQHCVLVDALVHRVLYTEIHDLLMTGPPYAKKWTAVYQFLLIINGYFWTIAPNAAWVPCIHGTLMIPTQVLLTLNTIHGYNQLQDREVSSARLPCLVSFLKFD